eukprot:g31214.t1
MEEAASFFGGDEGIEAILSQDEFAHALRRSGYGRPAPEQLFHSFSEGQNRIKVRDLLQFIALRLLAEERRERLTDKAEAQRRHKELELWAEDRIRGVEHLATESREGTAEIRTSVQEALQLGELSELRTLGAVAEEFGTRRVPNLPMDVDYDEEVPEEGSRPTGRRMKGRGGEEDDRYAGKAGKFERLDDDDDETGAARSIEGWVIIVSGVHEEAQEEHLSRWLSKPFLAIS